MSCLNFDPSNFCNQFWGFSRRLSLPLNSSTVGMSAKSGELELLRAGLGWDGGVCVLMGSSEIRGLGLDMVEDTVVLEIRCS